MNRHAAIELDWGDGSYTFRLGLEEIQELEEKCGGISLFTLRDRLGPLQSNPRLRDIYETLRCGLIGGGTKPVDALRLCRRYVEERDLDEDRTIALAVVLAAIARVHGDKIEEELSKETAPEPMRFDFSTVFLNAARMGIANPMGLSLGQWHAAVKAWNKAQGGQIDPPTEEEFERAVAAGSN